MTLDDGVVPRPAKGQSLKDFVAEELVNKKVTKDGKPVTIEMLMNDVETHETLMKDENYVKMLEEAGLLKKDEPESKEDTSKGELEAGSDDKKPEPPKAEPVKDEAQVPPNLLTPTEVEEAPIEETAPIEKDDLPVAEPDPIPSGLNTSEATLNTQTVPFLGKIKYSSVATHEVPQILQFGVEDLLTKSRVPEDDKFRHELLSMYSRLYIGMGSMTYTPKIDHNFKVEEHCIAPVRMIDKINHPTTVEYETTLDVNQDYNVDASMRAAGNILGGMNRRQRERRILSTSHLEIADGPVYEVQNARDRTTLIRKLRTNFQAFHLSDLNPRGILATKKSNEQEFQMLSQRVYNTYFSTYISRRGEYTQLLHAMPDYKNSNVRQDVVLGNVIRRAHIPSVWMDGNDAHFHPLYNLALTRCGKEVRAKSLDIAHTYCPFSPNSTRVMPSEALNTVDSNNMGRISAAEASIWAKTVLGYHLGGSTSHFKIDFATDTVTSPQMWIRSFGALANLALLDPRTVPNEDMLRLVFLFLTGFYSEASAHRMVALPGFIQYFVGNTGLFTLAIPANEPPISGTRPGPTRQSVLALLQSVMNLHEQGAVRRYPAGRVWRDEGIEQPVRFARPNVGQNTDAYTVFETHDRKALYDCSTWASQVYTIFKTQVTLMTAARGRVGDPYAFNKKLKVSLPDLFLQETNFVRSVGWLDLQGLKGLHNAGLIPPVYLPNEVSACWNQHADPHYDGTEVVLPFMGAFSFVVFGLQCPESYVQNVHLDDYPQLTFDPFMLDFLEQLTYTVMDKADNLTGVAVVDAVNAKKFRMKPDEIRAVVEEIYARYFSAKPPSYNELLDELFKTYQEGIYNPAGNPNRRYLATNALEADANGIFPFMRRLRLSTPTLLRASNLHMRKRTRGPVYMHLRGIESQLFEGSHEFDFRLYEPNSDTLPNNNADFYIDPDSHDMSNPRPTGFALDIATLYFQYDVDYTQGAGAKYRQNLVGAAAGLNFRRLENKKSFSTGEIRALVLAFEAHERRKGNVCNITHVRLKKDRDHVTNYELVQLDDETRTAVMDQPVVTFTRVEGKEEFVQTCPTIPIYYIDETAGKREPISFIPELSLTCFDHDGGTLATGRWPALAQRGTVRLALNAMDRISIRKHFVPRRCSERGADHTAPAQFFMTAPMSERHSIRVRESETLNNGLATLKSVFG